MHPRLSARSHAFAGEEKPAGKGDAAGAGTDLVRTGKAVNLWGASDVGTAMLLAT
jgi:hypothetical protein